MSELKDLELQKREELCRSIVDLGISFKEAEAIFEYMEDECILEITAPQQEESSLQTVKAQITHSGRYSGKSYKPGNIVINIKRAVLSSLVLGTSSIASIGAISLSEPVIGIFTIITTVLAAADLCKIELENEAVLILAVLWENKHLYSQPIDSKEGFNLVNEKLKSYNRDILSETHYNDLLEDLQKIGSIAFKDGGIILKEKVHILY